MHAVSIASPLHVLNYDFYAGLPKKLYGVVYLAEMVILAPACDVLPKITQFEIQITWLSQLLFIGE